RGVVLLKPYDDYYAEYSERVGYLLERFPLGQQIIGESAQKQFIALFGAILRLRNILQAFDDFVGNELLTARETQDYLSVYLDLYAEFRGQRDADKESIVDDVVFEIELVKQVEINVDYILLLVEQQRTAKGDGDDKEVRAAIGRAVDSSPSLRNKKDLIEEFIDSLSASAEIDVAWREFVAAKRGQELDQIIADEHLDPETTYAFVDASFRDGALQPSGTAITRILPAVSRFAPGGGHAAKKRIVLDKLVRFFDRFFGIA
ncbi:MAG: type I restriction endonuclease subunit R, partial [Actinomycetota bacterium]